MKIKTKSGFVCDVDERKAKDWRFAKLLAKADEDSSAISAISDMVTYLLGEDGESKLMEHVKDKDGFIPSSDVIAEFKEIMKLCGESVKKSASSPE